MRLSAAAFLTFQISISAFAGPEPPGDPVPPGFIEVSDGHDPDIGDWHEQVAPPAMSEPRGPFVLDDRLKSILAKPPWAAAGNRRQRTPTRAVVRSAAARLGHWQAARQLRDAGVRRRSTGRCASKYRPTCTSFQSIRAGTVADTIELKRRSHCPIVVTGGTERGHSYGPYSHARGYKLDIAHNRCIDAYIPRAYRFRGIRRDGAPTYWTGPSPHSDVFASEWSHWDILFR
jgi:hypothetical protein